MKSIVSNHTVIKLKIGNRKTSGISPNIWKLNDTLLEKKVSKKES